MSQAQQSQDPPANWKDTSPTHVGRAQDNCSPPRRLPPAGYQPRPQQQ